jgi:hypothetical protein
LNIQNNFLKKIKKSKCKFQPRKPLIEHQDKKKNQKNKIKNKKNKNSNSKRKGNEKH